MTGDAIAPLRGELQDLVGDAAERDDDDWYQEAANAILAAGYRKYETFAGSKVLLEVADERVRQTAKWGQQDHPNGTGPYKLPMPYGSGSWSAAVAAERLTLLTECASQVGQCTWLHILREEVFEAFAEEDPAKLRAELIQVAAVAVQWIEAIDRAKQ